MLPGIAGVELNFFKSSAKEFFGSRMSETELMHHR
jgi:hypothetical protein